MTCHNQHSRSHLNSDLSIFSQQKYIRVRAYRFLNVLNPGRKAVRSPYSQQTPCIEFDTLTSRLGRCPLSGSRPRFLRLSDREYSKTNLVSTKKFTKASIYGWTTEVSSFAPF